MKEAEKLNRITEVLAEEFDEPLEAIAATLTLHTVMMRALSEVYRAAGKPFDGAKLLRGGFERALAAYESTAGVH